MAHFMVFSFVKNRLIHVGKQEKMGSPIMLKELTDYVFKYWQEYSTIICQKVIVW